MALFCLICSCRGDALSVRGEGAFCDQQTPCRRFFTCDFATQACRPVRLAVDAASDDALAGASHAVVIESPAGSPVTNPIAFRILATPSVALQGLELFVDDTLVQSSPTAPLEFHFTGEREGVLNVLARGRFGALGVAEASVKLQVDLTPPQISFSDELTPRSFEGDEAFAVTITDNLGALSARGFVFRKGVEVAKLEELALTPFSSRVVFTVKGATLPAGDHELVVQATDRAGLVAQATLPFRKRAIPGEACISNEFCSTNFCIEGTCCLEACEGTCQTCGARGQCIPVTNRPHRSCATGMTCNVRGECALETGRFQGCSEAQVAALAPVSEALARALVVESQPTARCLAQAVVAGHVTSAPFDLHMGTTYPEQVLARMQAALPARVSCTEGQGAPQVDLKQDTVIVGSARVAAQAAPVNAAEVAGALVDALGFWQGVEGSPEAAATWRTHVGACVAGHANGERPIKPATRAREDMAPEVVLAPVGQMRGAPLAPHRCASAAAGAPVAEYIVGFHGGGSQALENLWMTCRGGSASVQPRAVRVVGSYGPGQTCASDEVAVGAWGWADLNVKAIAASCAPLAAVQAGRTDAARDLDLPAQATGLKFARICPPFMALRGLTGRTSDDAVNRIDLVCQDVRAPRALGFTLMGPAIAAEAEDVQTQLLCPNGGAVTELYIRHDGAQVFRAGGRCDEVVAGSDGKLGRRNRLVFMGASGGMGTATALDAVDGCGNTGALVGLRWSKGRADALAAICVDDVSTWMATSDPKLRIGPLRGNASLPTEDIVCPKGQFLAGWQVASRNAITSLRPLCREFNT